MVAIRVHQRRYDALDSSGAAWRGGRWNSPGPRVLYASTCTGGALLEILTRYARTQAPEHYVASEILLPDGARVEQPELSALEGWRTPGSGVARAFGDTWLAIVDPWRCWYPVCPVAHCSGTS
jgi:RES domain-containing protein